MTKVGPSVRPRFPNHNLVCLLALVFHFFGLQVSSQAVDKAAPVHNVDGSFVHCYRAGELEQSRDFIRWAGLYEAKQEREAQYRRLVYEHLRELRQRSGLGALALDSANA